eukprot:CAMPEP_0203753292 /NCGR_PEP_ID=MMETSP0098-20131031/7083_1 /ASSEMBLY_ACC=CAM_ASM_000208 /TAXON_ID=96639 /ORGANISM=" , Strain NY0313808BC1" /LENGTH=558 /DNA_ID=CAMNT_0050643821 /DNA_START=35 /DNA_END=1708 /DNA_ORIENTATION=+
MKIKSAVIVSGFYGVHGIFDSKHPFASKLRSFGLGLADKAVPFERGFVVQLPEMFKSPNKTLRYCTGTDDVTGTDLAGQVYGCEMLLTSSRLGATVLGADLTEAVPNVNTIMFDAQSLVDMINDECFHVNYEGELGTYAANSYKFSDTQTYVRTVNTQFNIKQTSEASYMAVTVKTSYSHGETTETEVRGMTSISKSNAYWEIKVGSVQNLCLTSKCDASGRRCTQAYMTKQGKELWEETKRNPTDSNVVANWNENFGMAFPSEWAIGAAHSHKLVATLQKDSTFDKNTMMDGLDSSLQAVYSGTRGNVGLNMQQAFTKAISTSGIRTNTNTEEYSVGGCTEPVLGVNNMTNQEALLAQKECVRQINADIRKWSAPFRVSRFVSSVDALTSNSTLVGLIAKTTYDTVTPCASFKHSYYVLTNTPDLADDNPDKQSLYCDISSSQGCTYNKGFPSQYWYEVAADPKWNGFYNKLIAIDTYTGQQVGIIDRKSCHSATSALSLISLTSDTCGAKHWKIFQDKVCEDGSSAWWGSHLNCINQDATVSHAEYKLSSELKQGI